MYEKIENSFRQLISSLQLAKLYSTQHPIFQNSVDKTFECFSEILNERGELILGIIGEELAFEKEIFFDLSKSARLVILFFKEKGIEKIAFYRGMQKEELNTFIAVLAMPKAAPLGQDKKDLQGYLSSAGVSHISVGKITAAPLSMGEQAAEFAGNKRLYTDLSDRMPDVMSTAIDGKMLDYLSLRFTLHNVMDVLVSRHQELLKLVTIKRYDLGTFVHSMNVSILAMHFSSKMYFTRDDVLELGMAALFHDIGKLYISRKVIKKPDKLTDEEFGKIKSHTFVGAEILLKYIPAMGVLPAVVAFEHHLRYDVKGYPRTTFPVKPHIASLIISICDVYDALYQRRHYKNNFPPDVIYQTMLKEKGGLFDPELLERFFIIMGVWPVGAIVALTDKRIAVVKEENEGDIFSPKVEVLAPQTDRELVDLRETKDRLKIEYALNPLAEAKEYLHLIDAPQSQA